MNHCGDVEAVGIWKKYYARKMSLYSAEQGRLQCFQAVLIGNELDNERSLNSLMPTLNEQYLSEGC